MTTELKTVQTEIEKVVAGMLNIKVEVTIRRNELLIYTENIAAVEDIKKLITLAKKTFIQTNFFEADEDLPAGATLVFSL